GNRLLPNAGAHEPLTATALTLRHGEMTVSIVACDLLAVTETTYQLVQSQVNHPVLLCCSHTHSGPPPHAEPDSPPMYTVHLRWMVSQIVDAVRESVAGLRPVTVSRGISETHIAVNRRQRNPDGSMSIGVNPAGPIDRSVTVLQFHDETGALVTTLANLSCHPTVLDPGNLAASADWVGVMRDLVESQTGAPLLFVQGACADLNPRLNHSPGNRWGIRFHIGYEATGAVLRAAADALPLDIDRLHHYHHTIDLPLETNSDFRRQVRRQFPVAAFETLLNRFFPWRASLTDDGQAVQMRVDVLTLGDMRLIGMGAEVFTEIGMTLKHNGDIFAGVTNGCIGYLPTAGEHALGGYEVDVAPYFFRLPGRLRSDASEITISVTRSLLGR
ncbi:MAG: hypothetical protein AAFV33_26860, partial [Chloroflexota bacterium]